MKKTNFFLLLHEYKVSEYTPCGLEEIKGNKTKHVGTN